METMSNNNRIITRAELADILGLSEKTVRSYIKQGMPAMQVRKYAALRFNLAEVIQWLKEKSAEVQ